MHGINEKCGKQNKLKVFGKAKVYQLRIQLFEILSSSSARYENKCYLWEIIFLSDQ